LLRRPAGAVRLAKPAWAVVKIREAGVVLSALRIYSYLRNSHFILAVFLPFMLFALPASTLQKTKAKFSPAPENFAQRNLTYHQE